MKEKLVLRRNADFVTRSIDKETILIPIFKTSREVNCIYTLNPVASKAWDLIDGKRTLAQIRAKLLNDFDATPKEIEKKLIKFLKDLKDIKAIV